MTATSRHLEQVAVQLSMHLDGNALKRSTIERVLSTSPDPEVRSHVLALIEDAGVTIMEDVITPTPKGGSTEAEPEQPVAQVPVQDPIAAARSLLRIEKNRPAGRWQKHVLKPEEEVGLILIARPDGEPLPQGGFAHLRGEAQEAAQSMLVHNQGLSHFVARGLGGQGMEYDDLVSHGNFGLIRAIELFDPFRGLKFSTYAMWWVRQNMTRAIANEGRIVRLPVHLIESLRRVARKKEELATNGQSPSLRTLAAECGLSIEKVQELMRLGPASALSLDSPYGDDGFTLADVIDKPVWPEEIDVHGLNEDDANDLLQCLDWRTADIIRRRTSLNQSGRIETLEEIGAEYNVTRERIRQIEAKGMKELRLLAEGRIAENKIREKRQSSDLA